MAPTDQKMKSKGKQTGKGGNWKNVKHRPTGVNNKRKWIPEHKVFDGSVKEGQGFAFKRKQKVQHEYNKLLRREKRKNPESKPLYKEEYPEHLRHLYVAEAEKLKNEAWTNRVNRSKWRMRGREEDESEDRAVSDAAADQAAVADPDPDPAAVPDVTDQEDSSSVNPESTEAKEGESLPMSNRMRKKMLKKTSYQKTKEEFESIQEKRKKKKEEFLQNKQQRDAAVQKYKQKKMEAFQMLSKKTKKGQPNLNLQMDYLLQKIQAARK
ncbi:thyroid transcription factor 1-associated protein 26 homolog [Diretmus argenteus]